MATAVELKGDRSSEEFRQLAARAKDANQARRLLALAAIRDGKSRAEAARVGGMDRQTLRDWVHAVNARGPDGLINRKAPGRKPKLTAEQKEEVRAIVDNGPDPEVDGVVRWRCVDLRGFIQKRFGDRLQRAEGTLDLGQALVRQHGCAGVEIVRRHGGAQDIEAVQCRLGGDGRLVTDEAERLLADGQPEVLGDLAPPQHGADLERDRGLASERAAEARRRRLDVGEIPFVAASRSSRLRARSAARSGFRQTTSRSPGKSGELISAMSFSSKSDSCKCPPSTASAWMAGARSAVIQLSPAGFSSSSILAPVIMPRSPTNTTRFRPKRFLSLSICVASVFGSPVSPAKTSTAPGQPSAAPSSPKTICGRSGRPSRLEPRCPSSQHRPSR